jgi:hypothetical protein
MPESNKAAKRRTQKANREAGLGDAQGRLVREKEPPKMMSCTVCHQEMKITKTNTELTMHSESKHGKTLDVCFPGAKEIALEMIAAVAKTGVAAKGGADGATKAEKKKNDAAGLDDLLSAGLGKKGAKK